MGEILQQALDNCQDIQSNLPEFPSKRLVLLFYSDDYTHMIVRKNHIQNNP